MGSGTNVGCVGGHQYAEAGGALGHGLNILLYVSVDGCRSEERQR